MGSYIPSTKKQREQMLEELGLDNIQDLFSCIPQEVKENIDELTDGKSELEVISILENLSKKNKIFKNIFRGAGAYNHYIPAIVKTIVNKQEFLTAYTPYQAEISQGILQSIFEYQTEICELTGMDVANASVYDGATAAAEALAMCKDHKRNKMLICANINPQVLQTIKTYSKANGSQIVVIPSNKQGLTDLEKLEALLDETTAGVYIQQPNFFGLIENAEDIAKLTHNHGAKFIMGCNPIALSVLKSAGECGADIAVGEGQPLGMPLSFGGPYLGFMACKQNLQRQLPGRIVGQTLDNKGQRAFVLTLQAREQHIRREKASSNICSNQALCALTASVYLAAMGTKGLKDCANLCHSKAAYLAAELCKIEGFKLVFSGEFFNEFVTTVPIEKEKLLKFLEKEGILGGLPIEQGVLWCTTEMNSKEQIENLIKTIKEAIEVCN